MPTTTFSLLLLLLLPLLLNLFSSFSFTEGAELIVENNCKESIWPGILGVMGQPTPNDGGFLLLARQKATINVPEKWSGRVWARTGCSFNESGKGGSYETGDCSGFLHCQRTSGAPPATVVEMKLSSDNTRFSFYDVSLADGFNLPVLEKPVQSIKGSGTRCGVASCESDLINKICPSALEVRKGSGKVVGCKSSCLARPSPKHCCTGYYGNPRTCKPTMLARIFKTVCPRAYTYAFDDSTSLYKCRVSRFAITFCPRPTHN